MCTNIKMGLRCTNIHSGVYTSQWMFNVQIYTMVCAHITMNVQTYKRMCTHITMDLQFTNIHNDVHTYHNRCTIYKHTQWCAHISQWMYNVQTYTMIDLISIFGVLIPLQQYFSYIMAASFSGGRSRSTRRKPPTMGKQLLNFITCNCKSSAPFFVIYKAGREPTLYWW